MIKILNIKNRNFKKKLDESLNKRRNKIQSSNISVKKIIQDVKKNGDKSILKYEKKFNKFGVWENFEISFFTKI